MLEIVALLNLPSQLRLALSCRSLLAIIDSSGALQRSSQFRPPIDFSCRWRAPRRTADAFPSEWWQLLRHLENPRWRCCSTCLKLHPASEFPAEDLARTAETRTCVFGPLAGLVNLCPCINLTFRDKRKLVAKIRAEGSEAVEQPEDSPGARPYAKGDMSTNTPSFWHECSHNYKYGVTVLTRINPILQEDGDLLIQTEYSVTGNCGPVDLYTLPRVCCPHRSIYAHIRDMSRVVWYYRQQRRDPRPDLARPVLCKWCQTSISEFEWNVDRQDRFRFYFFRTRRRLGKGYESADRDWYQQSHFWVESLRTYKEERERKPWKEWISYRPTERELREFFS